MEINPHDIALPFRGAVAGGGLAVALNAIENIASAALPYKNLTTLDAQTVTLFGCAMGFTVSLVVVIKRRFNRGY